MIKLAILGCGAIARGRHLPVALTHPDVNVVLLVDADIARAEALRVRYGIECEIAADYRAALRLRIDAAINALPNFLHASVNTELLSHGIHVLCEKPLATSTDEVTSCCEAAKKREVLLIPAMVRRFFGSTIMMNCLLAGGVLGRVSDYDWEDGVPFAWDSASGYNFSLEQSKGGVLLEEGVHQLDLLIHWFGPIKELQYQDDDWGGGLEANAILNVKHVSQLGDVTGRLRLSRTYTLKNRLLVQGTQAYAEILKEDPEAVLLHSTLARKKPRRTTVRLSPASLCATPFHTQINHFVEAVQGSAAPAVTDREALAVIELIQRCYSEKHRIPEPWFEFQRAKGEQ